jgi:hypothetical protein
VIVDHVTYVAADATALAERLRAERGLGSFAGGYLDHLGARSVGVPLRPPQYAEWLVVDDPAVAARTDTGRLVLAATDGEPIAWTVLAPDVDEVARRVGIAPYAGTTRMEATGVLRRWWTVTGPPHLPIFIAYDGMEAKLERQRAAYEGIGHTCAPGGYARIEVGGDPDELAAWLGPHAMPVAFVDGPPGIRAAYVETATGPRRL